MNRSLLYPRATTTRRLIGLDGMWRFSFDPESKGVEDGWALDLPSSLSMPVPASFCDLFTDKASREYCGDFWYETSFFVPAEWSGWDIVLRFGSVTHRARVFVNGVEVAQHEGGFLPFDATVTNIVRYNQFNKLSVLANNELSETMLPAGTTRTLADGRKIAAPYFDFYNYSGIHRPVWLMALPKERVLDYSTRYRLTETGAEIDYTVSTNGTHPRDCGALRRHHPGGRKLRHHRHAGGQKRQAVERPRRLSLQSGHPHPRGQRGGGRVSGPDRHPHL